MVIVFFLFLCNIVFLGMFWKDGWEKNILCEEKFVFICFIFVRFLVDDGKYGDLDELWNCELDFFLCIWVFLCLFLKNKKDL